MFSLHEITKMRLCRAGFLALCLGPLCAVLTWCVFVQLDTYRAAHERAIATRLGWNAQLADVELPRPGLVLYRDLALSDPHSGQLLAELPYVEIDTRGETPIVRLPYPATLNATRLDAFWHACREMARNASATGRVAFDAQTLSLHLADGDETFVNVHGEFDGNELQATAHVLFSRAVAGAAAGDKPSELTVTRRTHAGLPQYTIDLATGATPLPAELVAAIWPNVSTLGRECAFAGRALAIEDAGVWRVELQGKLTDIELDLVMRSFRHKLTGKAQVQLDRVTTVAGRIETAAGSLHSGPGVISRSLVQSAETHLHVRASDAAIRGDGNLLNYHLLCANFDVGQQGIVIRGVVPNVPGALLVDERWILVKEPPAVRQPVVDLVRTLVPQSEVQVPATKETIALTSWLPVPSITPEPGHEEPLISGQILKITPRPLREHREATGNKFKRF